MVGASLNIVTLLEADLKREPMVEANPTDEPSWRPVSTGHHMVASLHRATMVKASLTRDTPGGGQSQ
jgi:hypothetical protein